MSDESLDAYLDTSPPQADVLAQLNQLAEAQVAAERLVEQKEAELSAARQSLQHISEVQIPELMEQVGMSNFKTMSGLEVTVSETFRASIPAARASEAFSWLRDNGHESLIKRVVSVLFRRGEDAKAEKLVSDLRVQHLDAEDKASVHAQTLSAFVREQLKEGKDIPLDLLGVYKQKTTKVQVPKVKVKEGPGQARTVCLDHNGYLSSQPTPKVKK